MRAYIRVYASTYLREEIGICPNASSGRCCHLSMIDRDGDGLAAMSGEHMRALLPMCAATFENSFPSSMRSLSK